MAVGGGGKIKIRDGTRRRETAVTNSKLLRFESLVEENSDNVAGANGNLKTLFGASSF